VLSDDSLLVFVLSDDSLLSLVLSDDLLLSELGQGLRACEL